MRTAIIPSGGGRSPVRNGGEVHTQIDVDPSWSFFNKTKKETAYITHGYHRYPAKFIPQVAGRLIDELTRDGDLILDPFCGCGTTLVESKVRGRHSLGVDINPVAALITKVKSTPIQPQRLDEQFILFQKRLSTYSEDLLVDTPDHERIDYWFRPDDKRKLAFILGEISKIAKQDVRDFFLCGFSNILKNCSIWLQKSNKPTRDLSKIPSDPLVVFPRQIRTMINGNRRFFELLSASGHLGVPSRVTCNDARAMPLNDNSVDLILTSPPYVTSYEYADLHQLTALWLEYTKDINDFRMRFIGTSYPQPKILTLTDGPIATSIRDALLAKDTKMSDKVSIYFNEMNQVFYEMKRVLRTGGKICIVVGNTKLRGVEILNAEVYVEQFQSLGMRLINVIKREIPSKNLPSVRDRVSGRFASMIDENRVLAYPTEYILIFG